MAGRNITFTKSGVSTGTAAKTVLQVKAVSTPLRIQKYGIDFAGIANTDAPILVELIRQTSGGTMTGLTPVLKDNGITYTILATGQHTATVEPTGTTDIVDSHYIHPQTGSTFTWYPKDELILKEGTWLGLRVTAAVSVSCAPTIDAEE